MRPHKSTYWIFPKIEDEVEFVSRIETISEIYQQAIRPENEVVISCSDEKTGIQAIAHTKIQKAGTGQLKRVDSEYTRNGTTCLIASKNVSTGKINTYTLGETRKEKDYLNHIKSIVATSPSKKHIIICDQLNTHKSASLVKWIASVCYKEIDLGVKGKLGILKSQKSRMAFLENEAHKIRIVFTPKHCSWMNQIENWFGILQTKVITHGEFHSVEILKNKISRFIDYHNHVLYKPCNWSFDATKYRQKISN